jgi:ATP-dependent Lhr-like helicase
MVRDALDQHGAMFFDELLADVHLLPVELETALAELVAAGLVNSDSFAGLRALLKPAAKRAASHFGRRRVAQPLIGGMDDAGRWALVQRRKPAQDDPTEDATAPRRAAAPATRRPAFAAEVVEHIALSLLRRYGVVFWRLLEREAEWLPPWRNLLRVYQRLEARGQVRGGRFVNGLAGEQFALPEAIPLLRETRRHAHDGAYVGIAATDPLNLVGTLLPGDKIPAVAGNRVLFRDGVPVATLSAGEFAYSGEPDAATQEQMRIHLARRR